MGFHSEEYPGEYADSRRQAAEYKLEIAEKIIKRADVLLEAAYNLLNKQNESPFVLNILSETTTYDGAECDGNCLMEDIEAWVDEACDSRLAYMICTDETEADDGKDT